MLQNEGDPVESIQNSLTYFAGLRAKDVPVELHTYPHGGHAFGLRQTAEPSTHWPNLVETWLHGLKIAP